MTNCASYYADLRGFQISRQTSLSSSFRLNHSLTQPLADSFEPGKLRPIAHTQLPIVLTHAPIAQNRPPIAQTHQPIAQTHPAVAQTQQVSPLHNPLYATAPHSRPVEYRAPQTCRLLWGRMRGSGLILVRMHVLSKNPSLLFPTSASSAPVSCVLERESIVRNIRNLCHIYRLFPLTAMT